MLSKSPIKKSYTGVSGETKNRRGNFLESHPIRLPRRSKKTATDGPLRTYCEAKALDSSSVRVSLTS